jgi:acylglycerol lipase
MIVEKYYFKGKENTRLYYGEYIPDNQMKAAVIFIHGIFESFEDYENLARRLVKDNIAFFSFDYRGFGRSEGLSGYVHSWLDWIEDIDIFFSMVRSRTGNDLPLFYLAYSMGSIIGLSHVFHSHPRLRGIIMAATGYAFTFYVLHFCRLAGLINKYFPYLYWRPPPLRHVISSHRNVFFMNKDNASGRLYPSIGGELLACLSYARERLDTLELPVFIQSSEYDFFFRKKYMLYRIPRSRDKTYKRYKNSKHDIYKEVKKIRSRVFSDLVNWINSRVPPS